MADHLDEPPQKKVKKDPFQGPDSSSEYQIFFLNCVSELDPSRSASEKIVSEFFFLAKHFAIIWSSQHLIAPRFSRSHTLESSRMCTHEKVFFVFSFFFHHQRKLDLNFIFLTFLSPFSRDTLKAFREKNIFTTTIWHWKIASDSCAIDAINLFRQQ